MKCDYKKCTEEATTKGHIFGREKGSSKNGFFSVNACDKHKSRPGFYPEKPVGNEDHKGGITCMGMGPGQPAKNCGNEELVAEFESACRGGDYEFAPEYRNELLRRLTPIPRPIDEWHEDKGPVLWWSFPIEEPPYCGTPLDADWPDYHTHWTPIVVPEQPKG